MKEFINKLIEKLEKEKREHLSDENMIKEIGRYDLAVFYSAKTRALENTIKIINEFSEEYFLKSNWIPCKERLPELTEGVGGFKQSELCLITIKWWDGEIAESIGWYNQSGLWNKDSRNCKVIAWQPLPQPYKEGE